MNQEEIEKNNRFLTLLSLGKTMSTVGWVIAGVGSILGFIGFAWLISGDPFGFIGFATGLVLAGLGYLIVANGQVISCFVSIENNTNKTVKLLNEISEKLTKPN